MLCEQVTDLGHKRRRASALAQRTTQSGDLCCAPSVINFSSRPLCSSGSAIFPELLPFHTSDQRSRDKRGTQALSDGISDLATLLRVPHTVPCRARLPACSRARTKRVRTCIPRRVSPKGRQDDAVIIRVARTPWARKMQPGALLPRMHVDSRMDKITY